MRCFVKPDLWPRDRIALEGDEAHHLGHVLRAKPGQAVDIFDGRGGEGRAEVLALHRNRAEIAVLQRWVRRPPPVELVLIPSLIREQKMDVLVQKATELGVTELIPVMTERSVVRLNSAQPAAKKERWDKIALNAAKQSGVSLLPLLREPQPLAAYLQSRPVFDLLLVAALGGDTQDLRTVLQRARTAAPRRIGILIGPEGDLTLNEQYAVRDQGAVPVTLGPDVLRAETAAIYALSVLRYEFWPPDSAS